MFRFPEKLYTDVRIEDVYQTNIVYTMENLEEFKVRSYTAAFIRVFDGEKWYYSATSEMGDIQQEIDALAVMAQPQGDVLLSPIVQRFEANKGDYCRFHQQTVSDIPRDKKLELLQAFMPYLKKPLIKLFKLMYLDERKVKRFYSSKGAELTFDTQRAGVRINFSMVDEERKLNESYSVPGSTFAELSGHEEKLCGYLEECEKYLYGYQAVKPGKYTVILSPMATGVFAHESFGHKSEADFMVGDETMKREWAIGTKVGSDILSIVDDGNEEGFGYTPFDDEGTRAGKTFLIRNGLLAGRLHSISTAALMEEEPTGNGRALNFEFEPIVRMTCTYVLPGEKTKEQLIREVQDGILIETIRHGSGMSTFTMAPNRSYYIRNGQIAEPVNVSVVSGTVFETLSEIDGLSDRLEILSFVGGGCGKMEQAGLSVGFGGPYVRIRTINVQ
jgi:TldD protein